jgi:hypothetical protein
MSGAATGMWWFAFSFPTYRVAVVVLRHPVVEPVARAKLREV